MNPLFQKFAVVSIGFVLVGLGCTQPTDQSLNETQDTTPTQTQNAPEKTNNQTKTIDDQKTTSTAFFLKAETRDNRTVRFAWTVPDEMAKDAEGYRFSHSRDADMKATTTWWWERGPAHREHEWTNLPLGLSYFQLCIVRSGVCAETSNIVSVEIQ